MIRIVFVLCLTLATPAHAQSVTDMVNAHYTAVQNTLDSYIKCSEIKGHWESQANVSCRAETDSLLDISDLVQETLEHNFGPVGSIDYTGANCAELISEKSRLECYDFNAANN